MRIRDEEKIPRIYKAAIQVVNSDGLEGCSMSKIATTANVSPSTIYLYFENKDDMLRKLFIHVKAKMGHSYFSNDMDLSVSKGTFRNIFINHYQYIVNNFDEFVFLVDFSNSAQIAQIEKEFRADFCPVFESLFIRSKEAKLLQALHNDLIYSLLFAPLSYLIKKYKSRGESIETVQLIQIFEASWRAISQ